jgi:hypothetical protein
MMRLSVERQISRPPYALRPRVAAALAAALALSACSAGSGPVLRSRQGAATSAVAAPGSDPTAAECEQLRAQIRSNQQALREAPTTSTSPQIVAAAQAKADKRMDDTRSELDELDCPGDSASSVKLRPLAPMPPAPGAASQPVGQ